MIEEQNNIVDNTKEINGDYIVEKKYDSIEGKVETIIYKKGRYLGSGGFSKCYEYICEENNKNYAIKIINKSILNNEKSRKMILKEIKINQLLNNPFIVSFYHYFEDLKNIYLIFELCENKTLKDQNQNGLTL